MKIRKYWICPRCSFKNRVDYYDFCQYCGKDKPDKDSSDYQIIEETKP